jgi:hypothetical protein
MLCSAIGHRPEVYADLRNRSLLTNAVKAETDRGNGECQKGR